MPNNTPMINGNLYGWADIIFGIAGLLETGITSINYTDEEVIENKYGSGKFPIGRGHGQVSYSGSVTLYKDSVINYQKASPTGRLQDIPEFPIIVKYMPENGLITTEKLLMCRFKKNSVDSKSGDTSIEVELPIEIGYIEWHKN